MFIKQAGLTFQLPKKQVAIYLLTGQQHYQINKMAELIKSTWQQRSNDDYEYKVIHVNNALDWSQVEVEVNNLSLFSTALLLDARYDKKTIDQTGKRFLENYLNQINPHCLLLIQAPELSLKQAQSLANHEQIHVVFFKAPDSRLLKQWLAVQLQKIGLQNDPALVELIYRYNQGNITACAQVLAKIALLAKTGKPLTLTEIKEQLINQCNYAHFELTDACLNGEQNRVIQIVRQARANKNEPLLILWLLTQEIRLFMQLSFYASQALPYREAAKKLTIWQQKSKLYELASQRYTDQFLADLLSFCSQVDLKIKNNQSTAIWQFLELIALALCSGKRVNGFV